MGGNAFSDNKRISSKELFYSLFDKQKELFKNITSELYLPRMIDSKDDFGDQDIILPDDYLYPVTELLESLDYPLVVLRNSETNAIEYNVVTYQYEGNQIDLIFIPRESVEYSINYFSFGDHGNIIGKLLKKYSLKNSFLGFYFTYRRDDGNYKKDVLISYTYEDILNLLHLDINKFNEGFKTEEEVFEWLASTEYFDSNIYSFKNMNNKDRTRDKKRKFYNSFLKYLEDNSITGNENSKQLKINFKDFEGFDSRYKERDSKYESINKYRNKFNGFLVSNLRNIKEKELGLFMKSFVNSYSQDYILQLTDEELEKLILNYKY